MTKGTQFARIIITIIITINMNIIIIIIITLAYNVFIYYKE